MIVDDNRFRFREDYWFRLRPAGADDDQLIFDAQHARCLGSGFLGECFLLLILDLARQSHDAAGGHGLDP